MNTMPMKRRLTNSLMKPAILASLMAIVLIASNAQRFAAASTPTGSSAAVPIDPKHPWTAVASTGDIDEASVAFFGCSGPSLGFKGPNGASVTARYNVTNTYDNDADPNKPGWDTLELGSQVPPAGAQITATLWQVDPCTGQQVPLCAAENHGEGPQPDCVECTFANSIDFGLFLYYVEVKI
ncbi:MAG TPA: hypothetical protein VID27_04945, partial [Blastocatellia bacterium]